MKPLARLSRSFVLVSLLAAPAFAGWQDIPATDYTMAQFPAPASADYVADFAILLKWQSSPRDNYCAVAEKERTPTFATLFDGSGILSTQELAAVVPLLTEVTNYAGKTSGYFKTKFARQRPYDEDPRIKPCVDKPTGATSYPSAHAAIGALDGCVLATLFPKRAQALKDYGASIGELRVIVGVHHPSDVAAGQDLAAQICGRLMKETDFVAELKAIKVGP